MEYPEHIEKKGREERVYFDNAFEQAKSESKIVSVKTAKTWAREWVKNARCAKEAELAAVRSELEQENKRLAMQVEVLSAAFANSSEKEKGLRTAIDGLKGLLGTEQDATTQYFKVKVLEAEKDELLDFLENVAFPQRGSDAEKWNLSDVAVLATHLYKKHRFEPAE